MRVLALLSGLVAIMSAGSALAGDANCLWSALEPTDQAAILRSYGSGGTDAVGAALKAADKPDAYRACLKAQTPETTAAADGALQGYVVALASSATIQAETGVSPERLETAWSLIPYQTRALLLKSDPTASESAEAGQALEQAAALSGWSAAKAGRRVDDQFGLFIDFFLGRTVRDLEESLF